MSTGDRFAEQRRRNQTAYAIEDYHDAREGLRYTALGNLILSACVAVSLLSGADGPTHVLFALGSGGGVLLAPRLLTLERPVYLYLLLGTYTAGIVAEYVLAGLPSPPFPLLTVENGWVGFIPFANSLFPLLYLLARIALLYPLVHFFLQYRKLVAEPRATLRQLDRDLAGRLE